VRDALVVSARWHRNDAAVDDTGGASCAAGLDAAATADAAGFDAPTTADGHVFCLTASMKMAAYGRCGGGTARPSATYQRS